MLVLLFPALARAHVGSPDVFYDGMVGPWPANITIRMPSVVPGQAEILVQVQSKDTVEVACLPIAGRTAVSNAPPAEIALPVRGMTNLYSGQLWLMSVGAYSIEVKIHGAAGDGSVLIPVNSIAIAQLPLPPVLGYILLLLGLVLFAGGMAIVAAAAGESTLAPGVSPGKRERRKYWTAAVVMFVVLTVALVGGKKWWEASEKDFRSRLRAGGWPDLATEVRVEGAQRILHLTLGGMTGYGSRDGLKLAPDHGKLLHLFLVRAPDFQAFAHLHPLPVRNNNFKVALPPLPEGNYELFCDLTLASGLSSTATNFVHIPAVPEAAVEVVTNQGKVLVTDPDDSWLVNSTLAAKDNAGYDTICKLPRGLQLIWRAHPQLHPRQSAALQFKVLDSDGQPAALEPYMGMLSHAAVLRSDGMVFSHLHPSGNFSMAAQMVFDAKLARETGATSGDAGMPAGMDHMMMGHMMHPAPASGEPSVISLPYEFPLPGAYRIWVQIKVDGKVESGIFDTTVE